MTLTDYAIKNKVVSWMMTILLLAGGIYAYMHLGRLEDPEFTIKEAVIATAYPGASSYEVEEEITLPIETALQQLPYVDHITSISSAGLSQVTVEMKDKYRDAALKQIWDEMRRKINDMSADLPTGSYPPVINDDFGDVYGIYMAVTGDGYSHQELSDYVDFLRRELVLVDGVGKVVIGGTLQKQIILEISRSKLAAHNLSVASLQALLQNQNVVTNAGSIKVGSEYIRISSTGDYSTVDQMKDILLGQAGDDVVYLSDIADVKVDYADPPSHVYRFNGSPAMTIGISFAEGVNVTEVGDNVSQRLKELENSQPLGVDLHMIYNQPQQVTTSIDDFLVNLGMSIVIVIVVLLVTMGLRSGILMSAILLLTICGTLMVMELIGMPLHRVSLGSMILALGMLVDNAIVITDGILVGLKQGLSKVKASHRIVTQTVWPLFGATAISIVAFAPIGLSPDKTGEYAGSLFWVLMISLTISWILAMTLTPFLASVMFSETKVRQESNENGEREEIDPYKGFIYQIYKSFLLLSLRWRWGTMAVMVGCMAAAIYGFGFVGHSFFPTSKLPMLTVDYWLPQGSDIRATIKDMDRLEGILQKNDKIKQVTTTIGGGAERFMLTYRAERTYANYGQFIIEVKNFEELPDLRRWVDKTLKENAPYAFVKTGRFELGTAAGSKIEARITGSDPAVLRELASKVINVYRSDPDAINIRQDWQERTKVLRPQFAEAEARRLGITKADIDRAILLNVHGLPIAQVRNGSDILPVVLRPPLNERNSVDQLGDIQVYSSVLQKYVSIDQVVHSIDLDWEDPLVMRRNRKRTIQVWADADPYSETSSLDLFDRMDGKVEAIEMPQGYELTWGGEYENQSKATSAVFANVPLGVLVMFAITVMLFNSFKQTLVVWLTVPLAIIGVTAGLLIFNLPFSFTALIGFLSLSGMLLKNGIVLIEEIKRLNEEDEISIHDAITRAAVSRLRPVTMAALTTVLGLIPLVTDIFFNSLAVTIMFGLATATVLTLIVVPVLFAIFYGIKFKRGETI
ncbi:Multidrug efflux pump subunit AcrB [Cohaesibacter marisflavi]|uniref:Multidrug efflux pump subunit AcrB n=1 Tax=Cohaesibacter marisflavi TaxID=655353 RepID=A0A1I5B3Y2_9HYPH|nr:efflux RND transporter permease subunit [Cohaesibacter marisflavi]SFN69393.1 Multidrug efflux pump subunit AcrB [Cohaesibacter marisflavi]